MADPALPDAAEGLALEAAISDSGDSNGHISDDYDSDDNDSDDYDSDDYDSVDYEDPIPITSIEPNPNYSLEQTITHHARPVLAIAPIPRSHYILSAGNNDDIIKTDQRSGQLVAKSCKAHDGRVWKLAVSPDATFIVTIGGYCSNFVLVWNMDL